MQRYLELLETIGSPRLAACAAGLAGVPLPAYRAPAEWYGFPPALIPIWSDGSGPNYLGIWKHWFTPRPPSFVETSVDAGHRTVEIARTEEQFLAYIAIASMTVHDGVHAGLQEFARRTGIPNLQELDEGTATSGDDPAAFPHLSTFASAIPLESASASSYDGTFPVPGSASTAMASSFEFKETLFPVPPRLPPWLDRHRDKPSLFESYLRDGGWQAAWLTLNSTGWTYRDAARAARSLAARSPDALCRRVLETWSALAAQHRGGY
ncbi:hypothetical protein [Luteolibacter sp. LG18]|uniref:hypothetical protein n=1 Tax=Luteolibacter sp. LG18 TaxID=2819286 RepID=UPI002B31C2F0|nr:hypothetical protein llg_27180 [Luteolibacter sp. LG18]